MRHRHRGRGRRGHVGRGRSRARRQERRRHREGRQRGRGQRLAGGRPVHGGLEAAAGSRRRVHGGGSLQPYYGVRALVHERCGRQGSRRHLRRDGRPVHRRLRRAYRPASRQLRRRACVRARQLPERPEGLEDAGQGRGSHEAPPRVRGKQGGRVPVQHGGQAPHHGRRRMHGCAVRGRRRDRREGEGRHRGHGRFPGQRRHDAREVRHLREPAGQRAVRGRGHRHGAGCGRSAVHAVGHRGQRVHRLQPESRRPVRPQERRVHHRHLRHAAGEQPGPPLLERGQVRESAAGAGRGHLAGRRQVLRGGRPGVRGRFEFRQGRVDAVRRRRGELAHRHDDAQGQAAGERAGQHR